MKNLLYLTPKNILSRLVGYFVSLRLPKPLARKSIELFGHAYNIDFEAAERPMEEYGSINEFFTRKLKPGLRPIANSPLVHPADSVISQIGEIRKGQLIQAKGRTYPIQEFLMDLGAEATFEGGLFATYYLCPTDYHRVHSPIWGVIRSAIHLPGQLWPVNAWSTERIENLFNVNERVVVRMESEWGPLAVVFVGATNVGKISLSFDPRIRTNQGGSRQHFEYEAGIPIDKGAELGVFHMGSTIVICAPKALFEKKPAAEWAQFQGKRVRFGEAFL